MKTKMSKHAIMRWLYKIIFEFQFQLYLDEFKDSQLEKLITISKKIGDVMRAERIYQVAPENTPQEFKAACNAMSFW